MNKPSSFLVLILLVSAFCAVSAQAQTVVNPTTVEFDPSADHAAMTADNQPVVERYDLQIFLVGATQPMSTASLGKPAPDADGKIRVSLSTLLGWPLSDGSYQARVSAVGPTGTGASDPSNTFAFQSCAITLGSASQGVPAGGGTGSVAVSAGSTCGWTAASNAAWVTVAPASGSGAGAVSFTATANLGTTARSATLTIGGQAYTITQAAAPCTYALSAASQAFSQSGGSGSVSVTCGSTCGWTVSSDAAWVTVGTAGGTGPGTVGFTVAKNSYPTPRTATLTIGGQAYTINQEAANRPTAPKKVRVNTVVGG